MAPALVGLKGLSRPCVVAVRVAEQVEPGGGCSVLNSGSPTPALQIRLGHEAACAWTTPLRTKHQSGGNGWTERKQSWPSRIAERELETLSSARSSRPPGSLASAHGTATTRVGSIPSVRRSAGAIHGRHVCTGLTAARRAGWHPHLQRPADARGWNVHLTLPRFEVRGNRGSPGRSDMHSRVALPGTPLAQRRRRAGAMGSP